jgi:hypothetical protein
MDLQTVRAGPRGDAETGSRNVACLAASSALNTADLEANQGKTASVIPSAEAVAEADELVLDEIVHALSLIASYTTSAVEAAKRGDREELRLRLRVQLRDCFRYAVELHNLLPPGQKIDASKAGRAAT